MSIKGTSKEWFVGKKKSSIYNFWYNKTSFDYNELSSITYHYPNGSKPGNVSFNKRSHEVIQFKFTKKASDPVYRAMELIKENNPNLKVEEMVGAKLETKVQESHIETDSNIHMQMQITGKTKTCKYCRMPIAHNAKVCPYCARKQGINKLIIIVGCLVSFGIIYSFGKSSESGNITNPNITSQENDIIAPTEEEILYTSYTVDEMMEDLDNNPMSASEKYKDQYIQITGKLGNIDSDGKYISLLPKDGVHIMGVHCSIKNDEQKQIIKNISIDDMMIIKGKCTNVGEVLGYYFDIDSIEEYNNSDEIDNTIYTVGEVFENDSVKIMFIDCGDYSTDNMFMQPDTGNKYIFAEFSISNVGDADLSVGATYFTCYADDTKVEQSYVASGNDALESIATLSPDKIAKGKVIFEVPESCEKIELEYELDFMSGKKAYFEFE